MNVNEEYLVPMKRRGRAGQFTEEEIRFIRSKKGVISQANLAKAFGVSQLSIGRIHRGESYRHVEDK